MKRYIFISLQVPMAIKEFVDKQAIEEVRDKNEIIRKVMEYGMDNYTKARAKEISELGIHKSIDWLYFRLPLQMYMMLKDSYKSEYKTNASLYRTILFIGIEHYHKPQTGKSGE